MRGAMYRNQRIKFDVLENTALHIFLAKFQLIFHECMGADVLEPEIALKGFFEFSTAHATEVS